MKGYNSLSEIKIDHKEIGICPTHGYTFTSEQCDCFPEYRALFFVAEQTNYRDNNTFQIDKDLKQLIATKDQALAEAREAQYLKRLAKVERETLAQFTETEKK